MRITFLLSILAFINIPVIGQMQYKKNEPCYLPQPYAVRTFDTNACRNSVDTIRQMKSVLQIDTSNIGRYLQQFNTTNFYLYYQHDSNANVINYTLNHTNIFMCFYNSGLLFLMRYSDSCKVTEIQYDKDGKLSQQFYCDYSKPNDCYRKEYVDGKIIDEVLYTPFAFSQPIDSNSLNSFSATNQVVAKKLISFDQNGKITRVLNVDSLYKALQKIR